MDFITSFHTLLSIFPDYRHYHYQIHDFWVFFWIFTCIQFCLLGMSFCLHRKLLSSLKYEFCEGSLDTQCQVGESWALSLLDSGTPGFSLLMAVGLLLASFIHSRDCKTTPSLLCKSSVLNPGHFASNLIFVKLMKLSFFPNLNPDSSFFFSTCTLLSDCILSI